jgi:hypothetical protein
VGHSGWGCWHWCAGVWQAQCHGGDHCLFIFLKGHTQACRKE